jgi:EAL and modified HD-GYP domain-containing signal transduction protein
MPDSGGRPFMRAESRGLSAAIAERSSPAAWPTYVARQAILDRDLQTIAYELLFHGSSDEAPRPGAPQSSIGEAALTAIADIGLDTLVGGRRAMINVSRGFLLGEQVLALPPDRVGLEVHESVDADAEVLVRLGELAARGYPIALDGYVPTDSARALLEEAGFVKIDVHGVGEAELLSVVRDLRDRRVRLVAERIESPERLDLCSALGFHYFQGVTFGAPQTLIGHRIPATRMTVVALLNALARPETSMADLEAIISQDVGLSVTLLRYINSAAVGMRRRITSIRDAIVLLGTDSVRSLACLVSLTESSEQPAELARTGMIRAKMMELLALGLGRNDPPSHFTVGLLSVADAMLGVPMEILLRSLDELDDSVKRALSAREGGMGRELSFVETYERGLPQTQALGDVHPTLLRDAYLRAVEWADESTGCLIAPGRAQADPLRRAA